MQACGCNAVAPGRGPSARVGAAQEEFWPPTKVLVLEGGGSPSDQCIVLRSQTFHLTARVVAAEFH